MDDLNDREFRENLREKMPLEDFIKLATDEFLIKEYQALTIRKPQKLEGNIALTNKRAILFTYQKGLGESQLAMDIHLDKIRGIDVLEELKVRWWLVIVGIIVAFIGYSRYSEFKSLADALIPQAYSQSQYYHQQAQTTIGDQLNLIIGIVLMIVGITLIIIAFVKRDKTFMLEIKAEGMSNLSIGRKKGFFIRPGPDIDALIKDLGALVLDVQHNPEEGFVGGAAFQTRGELPYVPFSESMLPTKQAPFHLPEFIHEMQSNKKIAIPLIISIVAVILVVFLVVFQSGIISMPSSTNPSQTPVVTTFPTTIPRTPIQTTQPYTIRQTTPVTTVVTPIPLGQSATVTLPHFETLQLKYNKIYRNYTSTTTTTITYDVIPNKITEEKEISSKSGYSSKMVTYIDPSSYMEITVRDAKTGNIVETNGFGKTYSTASHQEMVIRKPGSLVMEITGAKVTVSIAIK